MLSKVTHDQKEPEYKEYNGNTTEEMEIAEAIKAIEAMEAAEKRKLEERELEKRELEKRELEKERELEKTMEIIRDENDVSTIRAEIWEIWIKKCQMIQNKAMEKARAMNNSTIAQMRLMDSCDDMTMIIDVMSPLIEKKQCIMKIAECNNKITELRDIISNIHIEGSRLCKELNDLTNDRDTKTILVKELISMMDDIVWNEGERKATKAIKPISIPQPSIYDQIGVRWSPCEQHDLYPNTHTIDDEIAMNTKQQSNPELLDFDHRYAALCNNNPGLLRSIIDEENDDECCALLMGSNEDNEELPTTNNMDDNNNECLVGTESITYKELENKHDILTDELGELKRKIVIKQKEYHDQIDCVNDFQKQIETNKVKIWKNINKMRKLDTEYTHCVDRVRRAMNGRIMNNNFNDLVIITCNDVCIDTIDVINQKIDEKDEELIAVVQLVGRLMQE